MVPVTGHAIGTRTGVNRDSNRLGTATTVQNSNISEWAMQRRDRIGHRDSRLTRRVTVLRLLLLVLVVGVFKKGLNQSLIYAGLFLT